MKLKFELKMLTDDDRDANHSFGGLISSPAAFALFRLLQDVIQFHFSASEREERLKEALEKTGEDNAKD